MPIECPICQAFGLFLEQSGFRCIFECPNGHPNYWEYVENCTDGYNN